MQTGIHFFDAQGPRTGDLWIVAGGPAQGKTPVLRNLAVGIVREHVPTIFWDAQHAATTWREGIDRLAPTARSNGLGYMNSVDVRGQTDVIGVLHDSVGAKHGAIVVDGLDLIAGPQGIDDLARSVKRYAVRRGVLMVVGAQLPLDTWRQLIVEGTITPESLPEWMMNLGDVVFAVSKPRKTGGADGTGLWPLRVQVCKNHDGLCDASHHHNFLWDHVTGRIE
jgi:hypothetical protein